MTTYGYCRVSRDTQDGEKQEDYLRKAGATEIVSEVKSGRNDNRAKFNSLLDQLKEGDTLIVRQIDRMGRAAPKLLQTRETLRTKGVTLIANGRTYDFNKSQDLLLYTIEAAMAENESLLNGERVRAANRSNEGKGIKHPKPGRPRALTPRQRVAAYKAKTNEGLSITTIAAKYGVARDTVRRAIESEAAKRAVSDE